jgi:hypothetical protein
MAQGDGSGDAGCSSDSVSEDSKWSLAAYISHNEALRVASEKLDAERDRRYTEVKMAEREALRIKDEGDKAALALSRESQTYKDTKANELREQIASERGNYATKTDLGAAVEKLEVTMKPMLNYMASQQGRGIGANDNRANIAWVIALITSLLAIGSFVFSRSQANTPTPQPQVIYIPATPGTLIPSPAQGTTK